LQIIEGVQGLFEGFRGIGFKRDGLDYASSQGYRQPQIKLFGYPLKKGFGWSADMITIPSISRIGILADLMV
jgi:hypothetical protein